MRLVPCAAVRYVDPSRGDAGFSPHRDRQPDSSPATFRPDGTAMYATLWLPLTDATPENSCLYVIPRWARLENSSMKVLRWLVCRLTVCVV